MLDLRWQKNLALQKRAFKVMPLGVNSNFRFWGKGITPYMQKAKGAYLWDSDDNKYIDYRMAFGPIILGHAYDEVNEKVKQEIDLGTMSAMTYELEIETAEKFIKMCPGVEMIRLHSPGANALSSLKACITVSRITLCGPRMRRLRRMATRAIQFQFHPALASRVY
jgi:glutamate-1-semialdehyde 2,1-aminomutase